MAQAAGGADRVAGIAVDLDHAIVGNSRFLMQAVDVLGDDGRAFAGSDETGNP